MKYRVKLERAAKKELQKLPSEVLRRICQKLVDLEDNPRPSDIKKLSAVDGYRLRVGDYRILLTVNDKNQEVCVYRIKHRKEVYE